MKTAAMPVFCGIISLYILVAGISILPILRFLENYSLAADYSPAVTASADAEKLRAASDTMQPKDQFIAKVFSANENSTLCRRAKVMIATYSFSDVRTKSCMGKLYQFVATRKGEQFIIEFNAFTDEFVRVSRILPSTANLASEEPESIGHSDYPIANFPVSVRLTQRSIITPRRRRIYVPATSATSDNNTRHKVDSCFGHGKLLDTSLQLLSFAQFAPVPPESAKGQALHEYGPCALILVLDRPPQCGSGQFKLPVSY